MTGGHAGAPRGVPGHHGGRRKPQGGGEVVTPRERAVAALRGQEPDDELPFFELGFQLTANLLGEGFPSAAEQAAAGPVERERLRQRALELTVRVAEHYGHSVICYWDPIPRLNFEDDLWYVSALRREVGSRFLIAASCDGTFAIPDGIAMTDVAAAFFDDPAGTHERARRGVAHAVEQARRLIDAGADVILMCADYCFNDGPFLSPRMFAEFVTPYLHEQVRAIKAAGGYAVKHTDGNILPILDQLLDCEPSGLHSLDPQGGVDMADVKRLAGARTCLIGGVHCGLMQTGSDEDVVRSCQYVLRQGMPGGGYMFGLSNVAYQGLRLERYDLMVSVLRRHGRYPFRPFEVSGVL